MDVILLTPGVRGRVRKDRAVELTPLLERVRSKFVRAPKDSTLELPSLVGKGREYHLFLAEVEDFLGKVMEAIRDLPPSPGRRKLSDDEVNSLQAKFIPIDRSMADARSLFKMRAFFLARIRKETLSVTIRKVTGHYLSGERAVLYRKYMALRSWFARRRPRHQAWAAKYYARPEVKERLAKRSFSRDDENRRQYLRYWAKKGVSDPPPWKPRRRKVVPLRPRKTA